MPFNHVDWTKTDARELSKIRRHNEIIDAVVDSFLDSTPDCIPSYLGPQSFVFLVHLLAHENVVLGEDFWFVLMKTLTRKTCGKKSDPEWEKFFNEEFFNELQVIYQRKK